MPAKRGGTSKGGGAKALNKEKSTPSGYTYDEFLSKSLEEREDIVLDILNNEDIVPPSYMEDSATSKLIWALGMDGKPQVVDDSEFDKISGEEIFRTVSSNSYLDRNEILDQINYGDYTRLSDSGGSAHGHAIYFAGGESGLFNSLTYGYSPDKSAVMRAKLSKTAKITTENELNKAYGGFSEKFQISASKASKKVRFDDTAGVAAIMNGYDGWASQEGYKMIINRSALISSKTYKKYSNKAMETFSAKWDELQNSN